nr:M23 family metallopeptidase [Maliibacterium massiliense]
MNQGIRKRIYIPFVIVMLLIACAMLASMMFMQSCQKKADTLYTKIHPGALEAIFYASHQTGVPWREIAVALSYDNTALADAVETQRAVDTAKKLQDAGGLMALITDENDRKEAQRRMDTLADVDALLVDRGFPLDRGSAYDYSDSWGDARTYGGTRKHEGVDLFAPEGTPVYACASGEVTKQGWLELGGWRLGVTDEHEVYYYYAHLSSYAEGITQGAHVEKGQLIGYVGSSGYGPEGTTGQFVPHLHFGLYNPLGEAFDPYPYLRAWEGSWERKKAPEPVPTDYTHPKDAA